MSKPKPKSKSRFPGPGGSTSTHRVPLVSHDYRSDPLPYPALKTEQGVFTTPPYSATLKGLWRFKDEESARESAKSLWERFERYRYEGDFIGMDTARKFIQMGRTRSLRFALRPGGRKYARISTSDSEEVSPSGLKSPKTQSPHALEHGHRSAETKGKEIQRTGKVYDGEKLRGAEVFRGYEKRAWGNPVYADAWERWKAGERGFLLSKEQGSGVRKWERLGRGNCVGDEETGVIYPVQAAEVESEERIAQGKSTPRKRKRQEAAHSEEEGAPDRPAEHTRTQAQTRQRSRRERKAVR